MIRFLSGIFPILPSIIKYDPAIKGRFKAEVREGGKLRQRVEGFNVWTLTGREFLVELMSLQSRNPRTAFRTDRVAYVGLGVGAQAEVPEITSLVTPVPYKTGEFLAPLSTPVTFPSDMTHTAVRFTRLFSKTEISLGYNVVITEAGLFTDGDPQNNWAVGNTPTDYATTSGWAPVAYKTIEPVTKNTDSTLKIEWEVRIL